MSWVFIQVVSSLLRAFWTWLNVQIRAPYQCCSLLFHTLPMRQTLGPSSHTSCSCSSLCIAQGCNPGHCLLKRLSVMHVDHAGRASGRSQVGPDDDDLAWGRTNLRGLRYRRDSWPCCVLLMEASEGADSGPWGQQASALHRQVPTARLGGVLLLKPALGCAVGVLGS